MQKQIIVIILIIIIVGGLSGGVFYLYKNNYFNIFKKEPQEIPSITFFYKLYDSQNQKTIFNNYKLFKGNVIEECLTDSTLKLYNKNKTEFYGYFPYLENRNINEMGCYIKDILLSLYQEGKMTSDLNELIINPQLLYVIYWGNDLYYSKNQVLIPLTINTDEVYTLLDKVDSKILINSIQEKSILNINLNRKLQQANITFWGDLSEDDTETIRINIKGDSFLYKPFICLKYTIGVITIESSNPINKYQFYNKCFDIDDLTPEKDFFTQKDLLVTTKKFSNDKIEVVLFDRESYYNGNDFEQRYNLIKTEELILKQN